MYIVIKSIPQEDGITHVEINKGLNAYHRCFETEVEIILINNINKLKKWLLTYMEYRDMIDFTAKSEYFEFEYYHDKKEVRVIDMR